MTYSILILDFWTQVALDAIWKEQVKECVSNDTETGKTYDVQHSELYEETPYTFPLTHIIIINR
jgi:hypothetical protein